MANLPTRARGAATKTDAHDRTTAHQRARATLEPRSSLLKKIYVGNLPFTTTDADLRQLFASHGEVALGIGGHGPRVGPLARLRLRRDGRGERRQPRSQRWTAATWAADRCA